MPAADTLTIAGRGAEPPDRLAEEVGRVLTQPSSRVQGHRFAWRARSAPEAPYLSGVVRATRIGAGSGRPGVCSPGPGARSHGEQRSTPVCPRGTRFSPTSATVVQPFFPLRSLSLPLSSSPFLSPHLLTPFSPLSPRPTPLLSPSGQCPAPGGSRGQEPSERNGGETARSLAELEAVWKGFPAFPAHLRTPSSRAEGLLFLHGLESNPGSSLQTEEEAGLP